MSTYARASFSHSALDTLRQHWQYVGDFFCMYSVGESLSVAAPGYLVFLQHAATFVFSGPVSDVRELRQVTFEYHDLRAVASIEWGEQRSESFTLYPLDAHLVRVDGPDLSDEEASESSDEDGGDSQGEDDAEFGDQAVEAARRTLRSIQRRQQRSQSRTRAPCYNPNAIAEAKSHVFWAFGSERAVDVTGVIDMITASILRDEDEREAVVEATGAAALRSYGVSDDPVPTPSPRLPPSTQARVVLETYEFQRFLPTLGWSSAFLLPSDPPHWSDASGTELLDPRLVVQRVPLEAEWIGHDWQVDAGVIGIVEHVLLDSPSHQAGLREGDVVVGYRTQREPKTEPLVQTYQSFVDALQRDLGHVLQLTVFRRRIGWMSFFVRFAQWTRSQEVTLGCRFKAAKEWSVLNGWEYLHADGNYRRQHTAVSYLRRRRFVREAWVPVEHARKLKGMSFVAQIVPPRRPAAARRKSPTRAASNAKLRDRVSNVVHSIVPAMIRHDPAEPSSSMWRGAVRSVHSLVEHYHSTKPAKARAANGNDDDDEAEEDDLSDDYDWITASDVDEEFQDLVR